MGTHTLIMYIAKWELLGNTIGLLICYSNTKLVVYKIHKLPLLLTCLGAFKATLLCHFIAVTGGDHR